MKKRMKLRPSASARWLSCTGSLILEQGVPKKRTLNTLRAAAEGTVAHALLEKCLDEGVMPEDFLGESREIYDEEEMQFPITFWIDHEMVDAVHMFQEHIKDYVGAKFTELQMQHSKVPQLQGTVDFVCVEGTHLFLDDLKYGKGTVQAVNRRGEVNTQLLSYASMAFDKFPILETARLSIVQPRAKTKKKIRSVDVTRADIDTFIERVKAVNGLLDQIDSGEVKTFETLNEGSHCYFCPAKGICPARKMAEAKKYFG